MEWEMFKSDERKRRIVNEVLREVKEGKEVKEERFKKTNDAKRISIWL